MLTEYDTGRRIRCFGALGRSRTDNMLVLNQPPLPIGIQGRNSSWLFYYAGTTKKTSIDLSPLGVGSKHWVTRAKLERDTGYAPVHSRWQRDRLLLHQSRIIFHAKSLERVAGNAPVYFCLEGRHVSVNTLPAIFYAIDANSTK